MRTIPFKETLSIEFKSDTQQPGGYSDRELVEAIVGMTNAEGGELYLGVENDGFISGIQPKHNDPIGVTALIANKTVPTITVKAETLYEEGKVILRITVPKSRSIISTSEGKILKRRLKTDGSPEAGPLFPYEIPSRLSELSLLDFSAKPIEGSSIDDFDPLEQQHLRQIISANPTGEKNLLELADDDLNKALHLVTESDGKIIPTVLGMLIVGKSESIRKFLPTAKAAFQVLEGTAVRVNEITTEPLLKIFDKFLTYFNAWNPEKEIESGLFRIAIPEFNSQAFREGLINAFSHRDYTQLGLVRVSIDDEGLSISNPGGFIEGITYQNLISAEPHGRNPALADVLKRIGLAERTGRGIDRIFEGSVLYGRPWPDYSESSSTTVKLFIQRANTDLSFMKIIEEEQKQNKKNLSLNALMALSAIKSSRRISLQSLSETLHLNIQRMTATVEPLVEAGLLEATGYGNKRSYIFSSRVYKQAKKNIQYVRQTDIDSIRYPELIMKLAEQQSGIITKSDVSELLKISPSQAYIQIKKLVANGRLIAKNKGKYARYITAK